MYKNTENIASMGNLPLFLDGTLDSDNRWVVLASKIPWEKIEEIYSKNFKSNRGPNALSSRVALGSLIIQTKLGISDEETVNQISENPYLQYFIGHEAYQNKAPFDSSMMTHFRKRLGISDIKEIDKLIYKFNTGSKEDNSDENDHYESNDDSTKNSGKLIVDATCAPADISYPTDLKLLNQGREKTEKVIDILWKNRVPRSFKTKPVSYRKTARSVYLSIAKQRKPSKKALRKAIRYQLNSIKRNLRSIDKLIPYSDLQLLGNKLYKDLLVIRSFSDKHSL
jgi:transposase, IS5 family